MHCVRFAGLRAYLERLLDDVALGATGDRIRSEAAGSLVQRTAERLNYVAERDELAAEHLSAESRELLGWFRYFADDSHFASYLEALRLALSAFQERPSRRWRGPLLVHFRPTSNLYRWRVTDAGTRIALPTPMIALGREEFGALAAQMVGQGSGIGVHRSMLAPKYRSVAAELAAAGGLADRPAGQTYNLDASFDRVNLEYFDGRCDRPRLTWGSRQTLCKFGHYDFVQDLVMLSRTLDAPDVPLFVVDHVMHHELLHKKHGFQYRLGRRRAHVPEFRREERTFRHYREADAFLRGLSRSLRRPPGARAQPLIPRACSPQS